MRPDRLYLFLLLICVATVVSGVVQMIAPGFVLEFVGGSQEPAARHFFAIIGMFMTLFGLALLHALLRRDDNGVVLVWSGMQKLGAAVAVAIGVRNGLLGPMALGVSAFDLLSGIAMFWYLTKAARLR